MLARATHAPAPRPLFLACCAAEALCSSFLQAVKASSLDELDEAGPQEEEAAKNRIYDQVHCSSVFKIPSHYSSCFRKPPVSCDRAVVSAWPCANAIGRPPAALSAS